MIRRDLPADPNAPDRWMLISQIEHALGRRRLCAA
jgi:hypothetical protein